MRKRNWRFVIVGFLFIILAVAFFLIMGTTLAAQSTDPTMFMKLVGQASGVVVGVSVALIIAGLIGKKA